MPVLCAENKCTALHENITLPDKAEFLQNKAKVAFSFCKLDLMKLYQIVLKSAAEQEHQKW